MPSIKPKRARIGHNMIAATRFVADNPGCAKTDVAAHLHFVDDNSGGGYATVNRAIAAGLLRATLRDQRGARVYSLTATPLGRQLIETRNRP